MTLRNSSLTFEHLAEGEIFTFDYEYEIVRLRKESDVRDDNLPYFARYQKISPSQYRIVDILEDFRKGNTRKINNNITGVTLLGTFVHRA